MQIKVFLNSGLPGLLMDYVHVTGVTVEGHKASHRFPATDKKPKHTLQPKTNKKNPHTCITLYSGVNVI